MKSMYKYELAAAAEVSMKTLRAWISERISAGDSCFLNYKKRSKILDGSQVKSIAERYCIVFEK